MRRISVRIVPWWLLACLAVTTSPASAQPFVYATHGGVPGSVSAFTVAPGGTLALTPGSPHTVAPFATPVTASPTTGNVYTSGINGFAPDPATGALSALPGSPYSTGGQSVEGIAITPDGSRLFAGMGLNDRLRIYSIGADGSLIEDPGSPLIQLGSPWGLSLTPDASKLFVPNANGNSVSAYTVSAAGALTPVAGSPFALSGSPFYSAVTPDGRFLYVTRNGVSSVAGFQILASGMLQPLTGSPYAAGSSPSQIAIAPDGRHLYTANQGSGNVTAKVIAADGTLSDVAGSPFTAGAGSRGITITPDGLNLYTSNLTTTDVSAFSIAESGALTTVVGSPYSLSSGGNGMGFSPSRTPTATFSATPSGRDVSFDASASSDSDGTVVRYDWDFGDGSVLADGGPTPTHAYAADGDYDVKLTVTDSDGCSATLVYTGQSAYCPGGPAAAANRSVVADSALVGAKLKAKARQRQGGTKVVIAAKLKAGEEASAAVTGSIKAGTKRFALKRVSKDLVPGRAKRVKLKPRRSDALKISRLLDGKVKAKLTARFSDAAGNAATKRASVRLLAP